VNNQVARLNSGEISADKFDYALLRFRTGSYGTEALRKLADNTTGPDAPQIKERASRILAALNQFQVQQSQPAMRAGDTLNQ
jgi:hypothetical protein